VTQAAITSLVQTLSNGDADETAVGQFYDRLTTDLARSPWFVSASVKAVSRDTPLFTLNSDPGVSPVEVKILGVFYDDRLLDRVSHRTLESLSPSWRDHRHAPIAYTVEDEAAKVYRLYPKPDRASGVSLFIYGSPLGLDFPPYAVLLLHTEVRPTMPDWFDLPAAWTLLAREYGHESNHRDDAFADFAQQFSDLLWSMLG